MTKKHYIEMAKAIKNRVDYIEQSTSPCSDRILSNICVVLEEIALVAKRDNPRFQRSKFMSSCGFKEYDN